MGINKHFILVFRLVVQWFPGLAQWRYYPAVSSLIYLVVGIVIASGTALPNIFLHERLYPICTVSAIVSAGFGVLTRKKILRSLLLVCAGILLFQQHQAAFSRFQQVGTENGGVAMSVTGTVISPQVPYYGRISSIMKIDAIEGCSKRVVHGAHILCLCDALLPDSCRITVIARPRPVAALSARYGFDDKQYLISQGFSGRVDVEKVIDIDTRHSRSGMRTLRNYVLSVVKRYSDTDVRSVVRAAFTGEKNCIPPRLRTAFAGAGLVHILALSGFHAGILTAAVYALLFFVPVTRVVKHGIALAVLWGYLLFTGPIPSLARAVIMTTVVILALVMQKKPYPLQILSLAAFVWLLISPSSLFQPGFQLSYSATFGIITLYPRLRRLIPALDNRYLDYGVQSIWSSFAVSIAAFTATLPVMLYHFGTVPLYGCIATLPAIPLMTAGMWLFFAAMFLHPLIPPLGSLCVSVSSIIMHGLISLAAMISTLPNAVIALPALYPEGAAAVYLAVTAWVTVSNTNFIRTVLWGGAVLACLLFLDTVLHGVALQPRLLIGTEARSTPSVIMQWPSGDACFFNGGSPTSLGKTAEKARARIHHFPSMKLQHWCACDGRNLADSSAVKSICVRSPVSHNDTVTFSSGASCKDSLFRCRYIPGIKTFIADYNGNRIVLGLDESGITAAQGFAEKLKPVQVPCTVVFGKHSVRVEQ